MITKNQTYDVLIESSTPEGFGICRVDGRVVFVSAAMAGEQWTIQILKVTNSAVWAKGLHLIKRSVQRHNQDCPNPCGGCSLRHMSYEEELQVKETHVNNCLLHIGKQNSSVRMIHGSEQIDRYRNKAIFAVDLVDGKAAFGFYRPRSHTLVPVTDCLLQGKECLRAAGAVIDFMNQNGILPYNETSGRGVVRNIYWRESRCGDCVLCVVAARGLGNLTSKFTEELRQACPFLTGIVLNINKMRANTILAGDFYTLWGKPNVRESLCGNTFDISPQAFLQINPPQAERLYNKALEYATGTDGEGDPSDSLALELYCGAGTITLCLAKAFKQVIGAEIVPEAIENAKSNAAQNNIDNVSFICADAAEAASHLRSEQLMPDAIVVDPPRKGLAGTVVKDICDMHPKRIIYISCNPSTLARDLDLFSEKGYILEKAEAFDMFPRSAHVETVCLLTHKG